MCNWGGRRLLDFISLMPKCRQLPIPLQSKLWKIEKKKNGALTLTSTATFCAHEMVDCKQQMWARRWLACEWRRVLLSTHYSWNAIPDTFGRRDDDVDDGNCAYAKWSLLLPYPSPLIPVYSLKMCTCQRNRISRAKKARESGREKNNKKKERKRKRVNAHVKA